MKRAKIRCPSIIDPSVEYYEIPVNFEYDDSFRGNIELILKDLFETNKIINNKSLVKVKYGPQLKVDLRNIEKEVSVDWVNFIDEIKGKKWLGIFYTVYYYDSTREKDGNIILDDGHGHAVVCMVDFRKSNKLYIFDPNGDKNRTIESEATSSVTIRRRGKQLGTTDPESVDIGIRLSNCIKHNLYKIIKEDVLIAYSLGMKKFNVSENAYTMSRDAKLGIQQTILEPSWGKCTVFSIAFLVYIFCARNASSKLFDEIYEQITNGAETKNEKRYNLLMFSRAFMFNIISQTYNKSSWKGEPFLNANMIKFRPSGNGIRTKRSFIPIKRNKYSHLPSSPPPPPPPLPY